MGSFSWICKADDCSRLGAAVVNPQRARSRGGERDHLWMSQVTVVQPNGSTIFGEYGDYGRVDGYRINADSAPDVDAVWHAACWQAAGQPGYTGPSAYDPAHGRMIAYEPDEDGYERDRAAYDRDAPNADGRVSDGLVDVFLAEARSSLRPTFDREVIRAALATVVVGASTRRS
jgi:hypothetical protein